MRCVYITFTGSAYDRQTARVCNTALECGATDLWLYDEPWLLQRDLYAENRWLWEHRGFGNESGGRGFGWFCWKPYIIRDALSRLDSGDMVLYVDADTYPVADFSVLFRLCNEENGHLAFMATGKMGPLCNRQWVKRECFQCMGLDHERYWHGPHAVCRFMVFQKGSSDSFLKEWQQHCLDRQCQTFDHDAAIQLPGAHGDGPFAGFREHRTEQAIYSLLCIKYGARLYREADEFGNECAQDWHLYPQLFVQDGATGPKSVIGSRFRDQFPAGGKS